MNIVVAGGGPAGLYFSLLMKKLDPSHNIVVHERNPRGSTFGWGVVFSSQTLSGLRQADAESHRAITSAFERWDKVDVVHRGEKVSIGGNTFAGIARLALLEILVERCLELGVELRFESTLSGFDLDGVDLLVGADGVGSAVREAFAETFVPQLAPADNRYIWLGTPHLFHGLTLTFRAADEGLFIAHSYKFNQELSTFIVECDPETFARSGFPEEEGEACLERLGEIFRDDLQGGPLMTNHSRWIRFLRVSNRNWFHPKVVLLGDALHTAHFSIGSGTKLALEDSIALAGCFADHPETPDALRAFETRRRPRVEAVQEAAEQSRHWFETAARHLHLDPVPFAFEVMTRSERVDLENLRKRDPEFVKRYEHALCS